MKCKPREIPKALDNAHHSRAMPRCGNGDSTWKEPAHVIGGRGQPGKKQRKEKKE